MPLNLNPSDGGDFTPFIKFNAKAGRWYVKPKDASMEIEIVSPILAFDMAHIKTGWLCFPTASAPIKKWDPSLTELADQPEGKFKRGFEVSVFGNSQITGGYGIIGLREFCSCANATVTAIINMYAQYEMELQGNQHMVPIFRSMGVEPIPGQHGTNYEPKFDLVKWVPRENIPDFDKQRQAAPAQASSGWNGDAQAPLAVPPPLDVSPPPHEPSADVNYGAELEDEIPF